MEQLNTSAIMDLASTIPDWADATSDYQSPITIDLRQCALSEEKISFCCDWLKRQPEPVIGIGSSSDREPWLDGLDIYLIDNESGENVLARISEQPTACAVLTQTTRASMNLGVHEALLIESLGYSTLQSSAAHKHWLAAKPNPSETEAEDPVIVDRHDDTLSVRLNSPDNRNALSVAMRDALADAFQLAVTDSSISRVEVTGSGPAFSAGGDLKEFGLANDFAAAHIVRQQRMPAHYVAMRPEKFTFYLHGACVGAGIELPSFASHVVADEASFFQLPEVGFGLIPGAGGCVGIPRRIGRHQMNEIAISGRRVSAEEALALGLIDKIENKM